MMQAFVLFRDRVTYGRRCVAALRRAGLQVTIIDHHSTYLPALDWLAENWANVWYGVGMPVVKFEHPYDLWRSQIIRALVDPAEPYIVTDCDVVPHDECPDDWPDMLREALLFHRGLDPSAGQPQPIKVGLSLDLRMPFDLAGRQDIISHEGRFWIDQVACLHAHSRGIPSVGCWRAPVDTTLAIYPPLKTSPGWPGEPVRYKLEPAYRLNAPYTAIHLPWWETNPSPALADELAYYRDHINPEVTHWTARSLPS